MDPKSLEKISESLEALADYTGRIAVALEHLSKCVWKNPGGDYKFQIEHSDNITVAKWGD